MTILNFALVREGDWVSGTTQHDEKFIGFVQSMNEAGGLIVLVTQSDREDIVGTMIRSTLAKVRKLSDSQPISQVEVKSLIELALGTHDKEWFSELSGKLGALSASAGDMTGTYTLTQVKERF